MPAIDFQDINESPPTFEDVATQYAEIAAVLQQANSATECIDAVQHWDVLRRRLETWEALVNP